MKFEVRGSLDVNPFCTRFTKAGALPFLSANSSIDSEIGSILRRWSEAGWIGQIVGPHGSGKSTLLYSVSRSFPRNTKIRYLQLRKQPGQTCWPSIREHVWITAEENGRLLEQSLELPVESVLFLDGLEQLNWINRWALFRQATRRGIGLIVTTHQSLRGLPILWKTSTTLEMFRELVRLAMQKSGVDPSAIDDEEAQQAFQQAGGNVREAFFLLYDVFATKRTALGFSGEAVVA